MNFWKINAELRTLILFTQMGNQCNIFKNGKNLKAKLKFFGLMICFPKSTPKITGGSSTEHKGFSYFFFLHLHIASIPIVIWVLALALFISLLFWDQRRKLLIEQSGGERYSPLRVVFKALECARHEWLCCHCCSLLFVCFALCANKIRYYSIIFLFYFIGVWHLQNNNLLNIWAENVLP